MHLSAYGRVVVGRVQDELDAAEGAHAEDLQRLKVLHQDRRRLRPVELALAVLRLALHDVVALAEEALEGLPVEGHADRVARRRDRRHPRRAVEQRHLPKVLRRAELVLDHLLVALAVDGRHRDGPRLDDVERGARGALLDDLGALLELHLLERVDERVLLARRQVAEHLHRPEHLLVEVELEHVREVAEELREVRLREAEHLDGGDGDDGRLAHLALALQRRLAEELLLPHLAEQLALLLAVGRLVRRDLALLDQVERVGELALAHDRLLRPEGERLEHVGQRVALRVRQRRQQRHALQEGRRRVDRLLVRGHQDAAEGGSVERPETAVGGALDGGSARRVVHERELAEAHVHRPRRVLLHRLVADLLEVGREGARLDHVKVVALLALLDDGLSGLEVALEHVADDLVHLLLRQALEERRASHRTADRLDLLLRLGRRAGGGCTLHLDRADVVLTSLSGDSRATANGGGGLLRRWWLIHLGRRQGLLVRTYVHIHLIDRSRFLGAAATH